jgi:hypothetical protein
MSVDVILAFGAGGGAQNRCPAGWDWDEARPQRVLPLLIDEDMETTVGIVKNTRHSRPRISAAAGICDGLHCRRSAMSYWQTIYIHISVKSRGYLHFFGDGINI